MVLKTEIRKQFMAGLVISIGCLAFLSVESRVVGAFLFSLGLILICMRGYRLFTGAVPYYSAKADIADLIAVCITNLGVAAGFGVLTGIVRPELIQRASQICAAKIAEGWRVIPLAMLCNVLIYFAVDAKHFADGAVRYAVIALCVAVFILTGAEHCVANAFYFGLAGVRIRTAAWYLALNVAGNAAGGILIRRLDPAK